VNYCSELLLSTLRTISQHSNQVCKRLFFQRWAADIGK